MRMFFGGCSSIGNTRKTNQDSLFIKSVNCVDTTIGIGVVCDGVGSLENGELASVVSTLFLRQWFDEMLALGTIDFYDLKSGLLNKMYAINKELTGYSHQKHIQTGTTLSVILLYNDQFFISHIGDSRIYKVDASVYQLTMDHTITEQRWCGSEVYEKKLLTQCIGYREDPSFFCAEGWLNENDAYLLCSDGFYDRMDKTEILSAIKKISVKTDLDAVAKSLVKGIARRQEKDNISLGIIKLMK